MFWGYLHTWHHQPGSNGWGEISQCLREVAQLHEFSEEQWAKNEQTIVITCETLP